MKIKNIAISLMLGGSVALMAGCSKTDETTAPATKAPDTKPMTEKAADAVSNAVDKTKEVAKDAKDKVVTATDSAVAATKDAVKSATASATTATDATQGMIDKAKSYIADKQYQPALDTLAKLKDMKLTDDQQKMVDDLKAQVQKLMASNPAGAASGLLGK